MLTSLRSQMLDVHADNIDDLVFGLRVWKLVVDSLLVRVNVVGPLEAPFAALSLANTTLSLEIDALTAIVRDRWPLDLESRLDFIKGDLAKAESELTKLFNLSNDLGDQKSRVLKAKVERLLS